MLIFQGVLLVYLLSQQSLNQFQSLWSARWKVAKQPARKRSFAQWCDLRGEIHACTTVHMHILYMHIILIQDLYIEYYSWISISWLCNSFLCGLIQHVWRSEFHRRKRQSKWLFSIVFFWPSVRRWWCRKPLFRTSRCSLCRWRMLLVRYHSDMLLPCKTLK